MQGLIGIKKGMTQIWDAAGARIPVTVIEVGPCPVLQVKTKEKDGYEAVQIGFGPQKPSRMTKSNVVRCTKAGLETPVKMAHEFQADAGEEVKVGQVFTAAMFEGIPFVDVVGITKGKGFAGVVRRWRFAGGVMTHGSHNKRRPGSIGMRQDPGSVRKGHPMGGHMGVRRRTTQNLAVAGVRPDDNVILVKGCVPGAIGGTVYVSKSLKKVVRP